LPQRPTSVKLICTFCRFGVVLKWSFCEIRLIEIVFKNCIALLYSPINSRPVSAELTAELSKYVCSLDVGQEKLFKTKFNYRQWRRICQKAGLADLKFHDLRKTFCSLLAQNGVSTAVTQRLLEHSSPHLTNKVYTNVDPVLRDAVEQLPVGEWL
jgi:integrase